jgi:hypothetical protein
MLSQHFLGLARRCAVLTAVMFASAAGHSAAQEADNAKPKLLTSYDGKKFNDLQTLPIIVLRPNVEQPVYLYVTNPGLDPMRNVAVKLVKVLPDNTPQVLAETTIPVVDPNTRQRVMFGKAAPALEKGKPIPWPELEGPPFRFEVWAERPPAKSDESKTPLAVKVPVAVKIMEPREYATASVPKYDVKNQRFSVDIAATGEFFGPKADVELVLSPEVIPGLIPKKVAGAYKQVITKSGDKVQLVADKLQFLGAPPKHGRVYVTVDGVPRAFVFNNSFTEGAPAPLSSGPRARVIAPRYAVPGDKCVVKVEVDDVPAAGGFVDLGFDRAGDGRFTEDKLAGFRQQRVYFAPEGPKGGMIFLSVVQDWLKEVDTADVYGPRQLRVQLSDAKGMAIDLVDEVDADANRPGEQLPQPPYSHFAPLTFDADAKAVLATMVLDGTPPEGIRFVGWPKKLEKGSALLLQATGRDDDSGISRVVFFMGPPIDGKMPPKVIEAPGKKIDPTKAVWSGELPISTEKPGKFEVSVQFTNGAGLAATETVVIELVEPAKKAKKLGTTVKGKVLEGELLPPGVTVSLVDDKGVIKATTVTDKTGSYVLEDVLPGTYRVVAVRTADATRGQVALTVPEGKELIEKVDIPISR